MGNVTRRVLLATVTLALLAPAAWARPAGGEVPVHGMWFTPDATFVARLDALSLRPSGRVVRVGAYGWPWARDGVSRMLVVGSRWEPTIGRPAALRVVDLAGARVGPTIELEGAARPVAVALAGGRIVVVSDRGADYGVAALDPRTGRAVACARFAGLLVAARTRNAGLVLLVAPADRIGAARLLVVDRRARVRAIALPGVDAGQERAGTADEPAVRALTPALVLNRQGTHAYVVGTGDLVLRVALAGGSLRALPARTTARAAKRLQGASRSAAWLDGRRLLVTGWEHDVNESAEVPPRVLDVVTGAWTELELGYRAGPFTSVAALFPRRTVAEVQATARSAAVLFASRNGVDGAVVDLLERRVVRSLRGQPHLRLLLDRSSLDG